MPSGKPKRHSDRTWDEFTLSREAVSEALQKLKAGGPVSAAFNVMLGYANPHVASAAAFMSAISSREKTNMIIDAGSLLIDDTSATGVLCEIEYSGIQKGSQGLFWVPTGGYRILSTIYN